ncbi:hypothetical protein EDC01DRAFT_781480 [Geopyxis carbonaria]|nr:hypothetical protein EDC01DRAFT_781480 [Geopyxis carbonaria]
MAEKTPVNTSSRQRVETVDCNCTNQTAALENEIETPGTVYEQSVARKSYFETPSADVWQPARRRRPWRTAASYFTPVMFAQEVDTDTMSMESLSLHQNEESNGITPMNLPTLVEPEENIERPTTLSEPLVEQPEYLGISTVETLQTSKRRRTWRAAASYFTPPLVLQEDNDGLPSVDSMTLDGPEDDIEIPNLENELPVHPEPDVETPTGDCFLQAEDRRPWRAAASYLPPQLHLQSTDMEIPPVDSLSLDELEGNIPALPIDDATTVRQREQSETPPFDSLRPVAVVVPKEESVEIPSVDPSSLVECEDHTETLLPHSSLSPDCAAGSEMPTENALPVSNSAPSLADSDESYNADSEGISDSLHSCPSLVRDNGTDSSPPPISIPEDTDDSMPWKPVRLVSPPRTPGFRVSPPATPVSEDPSPQMHYTFKTPLDMHRCHSSYIIRRHNRLQPSEQLHINQMMTISSWPWTMITDIEDSAGLFSGARSGPLASDRYFAGVRGMLFFQNGDDFRKEENRVTWVKVNEENCTTPTKPGSIPPADCLLGEF